MTILRDPIESWMLVCCPVCDLEFVCIAKVEVHTGDKTYIIDKTGSRIVQHPGCEEGNAKVVLYWECENGHLYHADYQFTKGQTYKTVKTDGEDPNILFGFGRPISREDNA